MVLKKLKMLNSTMWWVFQDRITHLYDASLCHLHDLFVMYFSKFGTQYVPNAL